jgi:SPP1 gp7 family putative phage head morphogenesis protein
VAQTVNELIMDMEIRHAVGVQRLGAGILRELIRLLDISDSEIVKKLLERGPTLAGTVTSQRFKYLLDALREINRDAFIALYREFSQELRDLAKYEAEFQLSIFERGFPVKVDIIKPSASLLNAIITEEPLQGKLLREIFQDMARTKQIRMRDAIRLGMLQGETQEQIIKRVRGSKHLNYRDGIMQAPRQSIERVVRTAVNHVSNAAKEIVYAENEDVVKKVKWIATLDTRTCPACGRQDGKTFDVGKGLRPPLHLNCRCTTVPVTRSWRDLGLDIDELPEGTRASMNGQVPGNLTFNQWLKRQSAETQDEALGPTRGALFRRGGLSVDRFTDIRGNQLTLKELRAREAEAFRKAGI